ncbi:dynein regulatory complex protein 1 [Pseudoscourfieldia marina]
MLLALNVNIARRFCALATCLTDSPTAHKLLGRQMDVSELCSAIETTGVRAASWQGGASGGGHKRAEERERAYWHTAVDVISPMGFRVWKALEKSIAAYMSTLQRRSDTLDELRSLQRQNEELRLLLNQYLASRINEELRVPPTAVI